MLLCEVCWQTFHDQHEQRCPACGYPAPEGGWGRLPYQLRGRFWLMRPLGQSRAGAVFLVLDEEKDFMEEDAEPRWVIKLVQSILAPAAQRDIIDSFTNEVRATALLSGCEAVIVPVVEHAVDPPPFLLMPYISSPTLSQWIRGSTPSTLQAAHIGVVLLDAITQMHNFDVVHCDLKPANIFIDQSDHQFQIKISDFGLWVKDFDSTISTSLGASALRGTVDYMSPEQMNGLPLGKRSDLHAVGSILWEVSAGVVPFLGEGPTLTDRIQSRKARLKAPPPRPPEMPEDFYTVMVKALTHEPRDRWADAAGMRAALMAYIEAALASRASALDALTRRSTALEEVISGLPQQQGGIAALWSALDAVSRELERLKGAWRIEAHAPFSAAVEWIEAQLREMEIHAQRLGGPAVTPAPMLDEAPSPASALAPSPPASGRRVALWAGLFALCALTAGLLLGRQLGLNARPALEVGSTPSASPESAPATPPMTTSPEPPPPPRQARVGLETQPPGARVLDADSGEALGLTPSALELTLERPSRRVRFQGQEGAPTPPVEINAAFDQGGEIIVRVDLAAWAPPKVEAPVPVVEAPAPVEAQPEKRRRKRRAAASPETPRRPKIGSVDERAEANP
ncbi:protein kinase [Myxococcota bacterium]|nr:protein kinase [Myxococcota bacterium]